MVVTLTRDGFIKRTPLETFRAQNRGGRGRSAPSTRGDDIVTRSFNAHTHQWVLFFSSGGMAYREKVWQLPEGGADGEGQGLRQPAADSGRRHHHHRAAAAAGREAVGGPAPASSPPRSGDVRRNRLSDFRNVRAAGLIAMKLDEGDRLIGVATCREGDDVLLATRRAAASASRRPTTAARLRRPRQLRRARHPAGRGRRGHQPVGAAPCRGDAGERAAYLQARQRAAPRQRRGRGRGGRGRRPRTRPRRPPRSPCRRSASRSWRRPRRFLLTVTDGGFGKRTSAYEYRVTGRGGQGIANIRCAPRNGNAVVATFPVAAGRRRDAGDRCRAG